MEQTLIKLNQKNNITEENLQKLSRIKITETGTIVGTETNDSPDISE